MGCLLNVERPCRRHPEDGQSVGIDRQAEELRRRHVHEPRVEELPERSAAVHLTDTTVRYTWLAPAEQSQTIWPSSLVFALLPRDLRPAKKPA